MSQRGDRPRPGSDGPSAREQFRTSAFADGIADGLGDHLAVLDSLGVHSIDLQGIWGETLLDLSDERLDELEATVDEWDVTVTSVGSPVGTISIEGQFRPHLEQLDRALELAARFDSEYVRVAAYDIPRGADPADYRTEVLYRTRTAAQHAQRAGVTLLLENRPDSYADRPERVRDLLTAVDSPQLRTAFDPANYLALGVEPYPDALVQVVEYVDAVHVNDARLGEPGGVELPGEGDGRLAALLGALRRRGFAGTLSLKPDPVAAGADSEDNGPDRFRASSRALQSVLNAVDADGRD